MLQCLDHLCGPHWTCSSASLVLGSSALDTALPVCSTSTVLHCIMWLLSEQTTDRVSVWASCPCMLFTPTLDRFWRSLHMTEIGSPGNLLPREVSKIFKCGIRACHGMKWSNEDYVIRSFWNAALMKNSRGNTFLLFTASSSSLQLEKREVIILGYFNVWELLTGYRFVLFVVKVPEVPEVW